VLTGSVGVSRNALITAIDSGAATEFLRSTMDNAAALHNRTIVDQFGKQAASFAKLPAHDDATQLLLDAAQVGPDDTVLDAAVRGWWRVPPPSAPGM
jgi:hypothetical protein